MRTISILIAVVLGITSDAMACKRQCYYVPCDNTPARVTALEQSTAALAKRVNDAEKRLTALESATKVAGPKGERGEAGQSIKGDTGPTGKPGTVTIELNVNGKHYKTIKDVPAGHVIKENLDIKATDK